MARKSNSRPARWAQACSNARTELEALKDDYEAREGLTEEEKADPENEVELLTEEQKKSHVSCAEEALSDLEALQEEYQEWQDNLPESLQSSPVGDKLEEVTSLSIDTTVAVDGSNAEELLSFIDEAEGIDLPLGFGKD